MTHDILNRQEIEEGTKLAPAFDNRGLLPVVTSHADSGEILMMAFMNKEALNKTIKTGEAHYFSRSRNCLWHKGATSGQIQKVVEIRTDCDQDAIWLRILPQGDGGCCHVGYRSCFYRTIQLGSDGTLDFNQSEKLSRARAVPSS